MIFIVLQLIFWTVGWSVATTNIRSSTFKTTTNGILPNDRITYDQYQQVRLGWTRDQLTNYVGSPGKVIPSSLANTVQVQYQGPSPNIIAIAGFSFVNGLLFTKSQFNFDFITNYRITKGQYNMIQIGWTYQQVTTSLGNQKGNIVSESGTSAFTSMVVQYTGVKEVGQKYDGSVTLGFSNGKLATKMQFGW